VLDDGRPGVNRPPKRSDMLMEVNHSGPPAGNAIQDDPTIRRALSAIHDGKRNAIRYAHLVIECVVRDAVDEDHAAGRITTEAATNHHETIVEVLSAACRAFIKMSPHERRRVRTLTDVLRAGQRAIMLAFIADYWRERTSRLAAAVRKPPARVCGQSQRQQHFQSAHSGARTARSRSDASGDAGTGDKGPLSRPEPTWFRVAHPLVAAGRSIVDRLGDCPVAWEIAAS